MDGNSEVRAWAETLFERELCALESARSRFVERPGPKRLHTFRTAARRLRSLLEDFGDLISLDNRKRLERAVDISGKARDARVLRTALCDALPECEARAAETTIRDLQRVQRRSTSRLRALLCDAEWKR